MKRRTSGELKRILREHDVPVPRERIVDLHYRLYSEWWYQSAKGEWYWCDAREGVVREWKHSLYGLD